MAQRILVIEDEPAIADAITYALTTDGFAPVWVQTGSAALAEVQRSTFSLTILDVGLPDANGFDLFRQLTAATKAPIIFLTARASEVDRIVGLEMGADDYVLKPFSPRELTARVRAVLRRVGNPADSASTGATPASSDLARTEPSFPFEVDDDRMLIVFFGQKLELSRYEFRLLKVLITRPGRVFTRQELMDRAWDAPDHSLDRTVDAHIKTIRAKLRLVEPDVEAILTHRGTGYSLRERWQ